MKIFFVREEDRWQLEETDEYIKGHNSMDNFDMYRFFDEISILRRFIESDSYNTWDSL